VARLGGDEFTILLTEVNTVAEAEQVAEKIQQSLELPFYVNESQLFVSASIGIAMGSTKYRTPEEILRDADISMYEAKAGGRNRYELFNPAMFLKASEKLKLENNLRQAIAKQEFELYYQPITMLEDGHLKGFEALVRWNSPERGFVSPVQFIPLAEETGLIVPLGSWILREAVRQLSEWHQKFPEHQNLQISINISGRQFRESDLLGEVDALLEEFNLHGHNLKLEITETILMDDVEKVTRILGELRKRGVELSIDDFGTGYSSLSYLHQFPLTTLKIDRSFINRLTMDSEDNSGIIEAIISLAHILKMDVIAEGVETQGQLSRLQSLNCEHGQGYFFAKPLQKGDAEKLIGQSFYGEEISCDSPD
jgi:EAL domain-containing protein (putative c-di-GMP-specific phosphodiesterase class I)